MPILKCKMCGGDIEISADKTFGTCDSCGSTMTFPKVSDEQRAAAFNRGNHFRRLGEFDKALQVYEHIVQEDPMDAEAHWCCALCRFGIEYVEDPTTFEYIPTCHRASFDSFTEDVDYLAAVENADGVTKRQYMKDGAKIADVQRAILKTSQNEQPFDVFICYKETDEHGSRTVDSTLAQDIYYQLTDEGYRVFFARITLEDKVGSEYEPYIFAALNSAKAMIVLGTKPEHFNAVWVKNEWSRYLTIVKRDRKKVLLPCYRDMDPYDLPEQLSVLQSYDMAKIGFMQDLIRGIRKITESDAPKVVEKETVIVNSAASETAPLLERAFMFLEDGKWQDADAYCEKVLDRDPKNAQAYLGKLMAELKVRKQDDLKNCEQPFDDRDTYSKAIRFGDAALKKELEQCTRDIRERIRIQEEKRRKQADIDAKNSAYDTAVKKMKQGRIVDYQDAQAIFAKIGGWKDADAQIRICAEKVAELKIKEAEEIAEAEKQREAAAKKKKKKNLIRLLAVVAVAVCIALVIVTFKVIIPEGKYKAAVELMDNGQYLEAAAAFENMHYKDSYDLYWDCLDEQERVEAEEKYNAAVALMESGQYEDAIAAFEALGDFKDSAVKADELIGDYIKEKLNAAKVGDTVSFGAYEQQDNSTANGKEDIEWQVLAKENGKTLVISRYALDCQPYNSSDTNVTWETCTLRSWLNHDFLNTAFTPAEQAMIASTKVSAGANPEYGTDPGNATTDKIFLLSIPEAKKYFSSESARECRPTEYAVACGAYADEDTGNCRWWLRSPGISQSYAVGVSNDGSVRSYGNRVNDEHDAVRPVLWINLGS